MVAEPTHDRVLQMTLTRRRLLRNLGIGGGFALAGPLLLDACRSAGSKHPAGSTAQVDDLRWLTNSTTSLDTAKEGGSFIGACVATEPILTLDDNLEPVGHLAESWHAVDPTTYVYKVRHGVAFWDGTALTPEDIVFAISRHLDPKTESVLAGLIPSLSSIRATGPNEVTVRLKQPNATWQYIPAFVLVAPKALVQAQGKDFGAPDSKIMGTGPFKVVTFRANDTIEYVANEAYWGQRPVAKKLTIQANVSDAQTSLLAMRSDAADGTFGVSAAVLRDWKSIPDVTLTTVGGSNPLFASFDTAAKPWDDVHVRRAFAYALDRKGLLHALLSDNGEVQDSLIPRSLLTGRVSKDDLDAIYGALTVYDYDLDKARAELAQSAYPSGLTASIWYYQSDTTEKIALAWADSLKQIGVTLKPEVATDEVGTDREDNHKDLGFHLNDNWAAQYPDPVTFALDLLVGSAASVGGYNEANYRNPAVDSLIQQNLSSIHPKQRNRAMGDLMKIISEDVPYVPIWTRTAAVATGKGFAYQGFTPFADSAQFWINHIKPSA